MHVHACTQETASDTSSKLLSFSIASVFFLPLVFLGWHQMVLNTSFLIRWQALTFLLTTASLC